MSLATKVGQWLITEGKKIDQNNIDNIITNLIVN